MLLNEMQGVKQYRQPQYYQSGIYYGRNAVYFAGLQKPIPASDVQLVLRYCGYNSQVTILHFIA